MDSHTTTELMTLGEIARELGQPIHRVKYAIDAYHIAPVRRAGIIRLFSRQDLPRIKSVLTAARGVSHAR